MNVKTVKRKLKVRKKSVRNGLKGWSRERGEIKVKANTNKNNRKGNETVSTNIQIIAMHG
jgi:hypothetical protein